MSRQRSLTVKTLTDRFEEGAGTIYEIARAELKKAEIDRQQTAHEGDERKLATQIFLNGFKEPPNLPVVALPAVEQTPGVMFNHPLIREAQLARESAELNLRATQSKRLPQLSLDLSLANRRYEGDRPGNQADYSALVTLSYPIFDGGSGGAREDEAAAKYRQSDLDLDQRQRTIKELEARSLTDIAVSTDTVLRNKRTLQSSLQTYSAARELFRIKRSDLQDLQRAEDEVYAEGVRLIENWFELSQSTYRHLHLRGSLMPFLGLQNIECDQHSSIQRY